MHHHGRGLFQLTKDKSLVEAIIADYKTADISDKDRSMLDYVALLTEDPCNIGRKDFDKVKAAGFSEADVLDLVQVTAYFNYVNRLACGLGVELESYWDED